MNPLLELSQLLGDRICPTQGNSNEPSKRRSQVKDNKHKNSRSDFRKLQHRTKSESKRRQQVDGDGDGRSFWESRRGLVDHTYKTSSAERVCWCLGDLGPFHHEHRWNLTAARPCRQSDIADLQMRPSPCTHILATSSTVCSNAKTELIMSQPSQPRRRSELTPCDAESQESPGECRNIESSTLSTPEAQQVKGRKSGWCVERLMQQPPKSTRLQHATSGG